ncbi:hypothetical protein ACFYYY_04180 [Streptomyces sp. NPDC001834]|uniref:hypothetical protein n=1 Tax=Streptomyces sp. NPDC001834 TaxID=3364616 RepID=UPI00368E4B01
MSCSDEAEREYRVPNALCGTSVSTELLSPFLPPGKKVSEKSLTPADGIARCQVLVDGEIALVVSREWWSDKPNLTEIAQGQAYVELENFSDDGRYIHSERGAVGKADCARPVKPGNELFTVVQVPEPGRANADAVKALITGYTESMSSSDQCTRNE